jgi:fructoselysine-6-P-deglycase FrlB-like protein
MQVARHIQEQAAVLPAVAHDVRRQLRGITAARLPERMTLVGVGSSMNALVAASDYLVRRTGAAVEFREPLGFVDLPPKQGLVIAMSQGGRSATTVAAARHACALGLPTIAITADGASDIAQSGAQIVTLPIGEETIGPKTKGYTASVMSLLMLADHLAGVENAVDGLEADLEIFITVTAARARALCERLGAVDFITIAGRLGHVGTALEAALKIVEMSGVPAVGLDLEEAMHGRFHAHGPRSMAILIVRTEAERAMAHHTVTVLGERGTTALVCDLGDGPCLEGSPLPWPRIGTAIGWDVVWAPIPFQMLAASLARARGLVPADMVYPGLGRALGTKLVA